MSIGENLSKALINKYGQDAQRLKAIEECGELIHILSKTLNAPTGFPGYDNAIQHEIVDVMITLESLKSIYGIEAINKIYENKILDLWEIHFPVNSK